MGRRLFFSPWMYDETGMAAKKASGSKRKPSAFIKFMAVFRAKPETKDFIEKAKAAGKKYPIAELGKKGGEAWGKLTDAEKAKYK